MTTVRATLLPLMAGALLGLAPGAALAQDPLPPPQSVASVGDELVLKVSFERWLRAAAVAQAGRPPEASVIDPPRYRDCVAARARLRPEVPRRALRRQCAGDFRELMPSVMTFLIDGLWIRGEAARRDIAVDAATVRSAFARRKREAFADERAYRRYLRRNATRESMLLYQVRIDLLTARIRRQVIEGVPREQQAAALGAFARELRTRWRPRTRCEPGFLVTGCSNF